MKTYRVIPLPLFYWEAVITTIWFTAITTSYQQNQPAGAGDISSKTKTNNLSQTEQWSQGHALTNKTTNRTRGQSTRTHTYISSSNTIVTGGGRTMLSMKRGWESNFLSYRGSKSGESWHGSAEPRTNQTSAVGKNKTGRCKVCKRSITRRA